MARSDFEALLSLFAQGVIGWFQDAKATWLVADRIEGLQHTVASLFQKTPLPKRASFSEIFPAHAALAGWTEPTAGDLSSQALAWRASRAAENPEYDAALKSGGAYDEEAIDAED